MGLLSPTEAGRRIRQRREELGITQAELGRRIHRTQNSISNYERGTSSPSRQDAVLLAGALDLKVEDLLFDTPAKTEPAVAEG